jgi:hypothetical protein
MLFDFEMVSCGDRHAMREFGHNPLAGRDARDGLVNRRLPATVIRFAFAASATSLNP